MQAALVFLWQPEAGLVDFKKQILIRTAPDIGELPNCQVEFLTVTGAVLSL